MEYRQYFLPDGRIFDIVFYTGSGGDQDFGIYLSDGRDVGRVYQRANATLYTGYYSAGVDIGNKLLSTAAVARAPSTDVTTWTFSAMGKWGYSYAPMQWVIQGGSGNFTIGNVFTDNNTFGPESTINGAPAGHNGSSKHVPMLRNRRYDQVQHIFYVELFLCTDYTGDHSGPFWRYVDVNRVRFRFTDNLTGVSYISDPHLILKIDSSTLPAEYNQYKSRCDFNCACDYDCGCDSYSSDTDHE